MFWEERVGKVRKRLPNWMQSGVLVRVERTPLDCQRIDGFIVGVSRRLLALQVVDGSTLTLNGYTVVRLQDVRRVRKDNSFVPQALARLGRKAAPPPALRLTNWPSLLKSANQRYPLLMLEFEVRRPNCGYVGRVDKIQNETLRLRKVDTQARWKKGEKFKLRHLTRVSFGDGYLAALELVTSEQTP